MNRMLLYFFAAGIISFSGCQSTPPPASVPNQIVMASDTSYQLFSDGSIADSEGQIVVSGQDSSGNPKPVTKYHLDSVESSDPDVADISADGVINAVSVGEATAAIDIGGKKYFVSIIVKPAIHDLLIDQDSLNLKSGESSAIQVIARAFGKVLSPSELEKIVLYKSSDESVATVDPSGSVTAVSSGDAVITVYADGIVPVSQVCPVKVE